jgi:hypothetical protein
MEKMCNNKREDSFFNIFPNRINNQQLYNILKMHVNACIWGCVGVRLACYGVMWGCVGVMLGCCGGATCTCAGMTWIVGRLLYELYI